jgi:hypothetical protein
LISRSPPFGADILAGKRRCRLELDQKIRAGFFVVTVKLVGYDEIGRRLVANRFRP